MPKKRKPYEEEALTGPTPEPEGILSKAKSVGLSGLSYAGNLLGVPGAVVRNALGGKNPLTPLMHPLSGEGRVEGRDLLRQNGLVGRKDTWGNWGAGLAVDIATDPLTFINPFGAATKLGAVTKAGRVAHAAGALDDVTKAATAIGRRAGRIGATETVGRASARARTTLDELLNFGDDALKATRREAARNAAQKMGANFDELLNQPLGGVANWWVPGVGSGTLGASQGGAEFMEGIGKVAGLIPGAKAAKASASAAKRVVKGLFHGASGGRFDKYGQHVSELASQKMPAARRAVVQESLGFWDRFKQVDSDFKKAFSPDAGQSPDGWRELSPDEVLQPGAKTRLDVGSGKSYVFEGVKQSAKPFSEGDLVQAADRGNYGYVKSVADDGAEVHFTHPETGATATVKLPFEKLSKANSSDLPESLRAAHDPVSRVFDRILRMTAETGGDVDSAIEKFATGSNVSPELREDIRKLAEDATAAKDAIWQQNLDMGGNGRVLGESEDFQHFPRYVSQRGTGPLDTFRQLPTGHDSVTARKEILRNLRADQIEELRMNPKYREEDAAWQIFKDFGDSLGYKAKDETVDATRHAAELAEYASKASVDAVEKRKRLFDNMTFKDLGQYLLQGHKRNASLRAIHEAFHMNLSDSGAPLVDAFKFAGMDTERAMAHFAKVAGLSPEQLATARIPPELANAAAAVIKTYESPEWSNLVTKTLDTVNRYFKPAMVLVKPSFWFRNHTSGQYANLVSGYVNSVGDISDYASAYKEVNRLWKAKDKAFERELEIFGVLGSDSTLEAHQHIYQGAGPSHTALPPNPLDFRETAKEVQQRLTADPQGIFGKSVAGVRKGAGTWMETNAKANRVVEYHNRASLYQYLKGKGYSPEQAAKIVTEVHYDYSTQAMAPFERDVMRRIVPFYVFSRNNLPWTVERLLTSPGGPMAQTIKALSREHRHEDLSPEYLSETASIPLGDLPDGSRRYLTGLGLGFEDPAGFATPSLKQVGLEAVSRTNPLIKGPLEYMFGRSAFQKGPFGGRDLEDLDPALGRTIANIGQITGLRKSTDPVRYPGSGLLEHVLSNSPLAAVATTARTITDPRKSTVAKAVNLTSGVHLSDVSPASMDRELRNRVARIQKSMGGRQFTDAYIPKETLAAMTPEQRSEAERLNELKRLLNQRSKKRATDAK